MDNRVISKFIDRVQSSLNRQLILELMVDASLLCGGGMVIVGLIFLIRGYKVELPYLIMPFMLALLFMLIGYRRRHYDKTQTAIYADRKFSMNNGLVATLDFEQQSVTDGFHQLHFVATAEKCAAADLTSLRLAWPWHKLVISCCLGGGALILAMLDSSPMIIASEARQRLTLTTTDEVNNDLRQELKALEQKLSPAEKKILEQAKLDKLVKDLKPRDKFKDAMRQYAKLEQALNRLSANQQFKSNQRLLNEIARQLLKDLTTKKLGQQFMNGKYRQAGQLLRKFKQAGDKQKSLEQLKKVLAKMKKAAEQLVGNKSEFREKLSALKSAVDRYDQQLKQSTTKSDNNAKAALAKAGRQTEEQLDNLSEALEQQQVTDEFLKKLMKLRKAMQQAQQKMRGMQQGAGMKGQGGMPIKGQGRQAGTGAEVGAAVAQNRREVGDDVKANGKLSKVTGQQGSGPTQKNIETSASGSAISQRQTRKLANEFSYKMEEFIERNDVPDGMKDGVKRYFSDLHKK